MLLAQEKSSALRGRRRGGEPRRRDGKSRSCRAGEQRGAVDEFIEQDRMQRQVKGRPFGRGPHRLARRERRAGLG